MKKLKILHIGHGKAFKIKAILSFFRDRGHEIHFIPMPPIENKWEGIVLHRLKPFGRFSKIQVLKNILLIRRILKKIKPDIIHAHNARGPGWYGAFCSHHPFVIHAYGCDLLPFHYSAKDIFSKILTMYTCRQSDKIVVTGQHMIEKSDHLRIPEDKIMVLPRGVDLGGRRIIKKTTFLKKEFQLNESSPIIFSPRYQIDEELYNIGTIIKSIPYVKNFLPDVLYIQLYGENMEKEKQKYEKIAEKLLVSENYKMIKAVDNEQMPYFYNLADIFVSVPSSDGFPATVLEASACGTPMIVTKLDYTSEWFKDGENGILIPDKDPVALANAVIELYKNKPLQQKMKEINRKLVVERANYENCMTELETLYYELLCKYKN
jgi:glycosyltransferase involved in cell wall biosynthesis